jgi:dCMP deaminase
MKDPDMNDHERLSWDQYFMTIAQVVASRSTCDRKHVGAVIVRDRTLLSTGYNGSIRGLPHCDEVGHMMENDHCVATIHAEANALVQAARNGVNINGGSIYITASPCWNCFKLIANAGIEAICYGEFYRDDRIFEIAQTLNIRLEHVAGALPGWTGAAAPRIANE